MTPEPDWLRTFCETRSESAFEALVQRHLDVVFSVAHRLTRDGHLAEDVVQAVFVALANQADDVARRVAHGTPLSAWLHLTTRNQALKMIRREARRRARERATIPMDAPSSSESPDEALWERIAPFLDHHLARLSDQDRNALMLRFFERKTAREIADQLGIGEHAAQKRVLRAVDRLRLALSRQVPEITPSALPVLLGSFAVQQTPHSLATSITHTSLGGAAATAPAGIQAWLSGAGMDLASHLLMTKTQATLTGAVIAACAVPITLQQIELLELRAEPNANVSIRNAVFDAPAPPAPAAGGNPSTSSPHTAAEALEIDRLRARAAALRSEIASRSGITQARVHEAPPQGPVLLQPGRAVPVSDLGAAGNATPEAATQSLLALMRDGQLEAVLNSWLLSPKDQAEWEEDMANHPEKQDELAQRMMNEVAPLLTVELVEVVPIDPRRSRVLLERVSGTSTNQFQMTFGRTASGWKQIP